ncbi:hypothetical protein CAOG_00109 [Capsaspora owczarzaki ATCC 30864]|uniref:DNA replication complex GINS protein SLD5 n=1 Tax=Capsaspora owczarzaki (strain ATCC 30864) TaxID=595528 RepID=A0A0D2WHX9_CAPO3|nr:hypothetical protein CAOG_00109 [Capsaspora owczarzaki ATCC 30864]KJE88453.1 hypothetical protein CAOG_000109 [Capsaspora owczarzaki ATCC 30864]|eukprot:XP_004364980.1 hypothetical protein CAOG_00109 [Capsaspora owczarzaki ATCC 30864]
MFQDDLDDSAFDAELNNDVRRLKQSWLNEKNAPEILQFESELVKDLTDNVQTQIRQLSEIQSSDVMTAFANNLKRMEYDRLLFVIRSYLRTRLTKIQRHAMYILSSAEMRQRLSPEELRFTHSYVTLSEQHYSNSCLHDFPEMIQRLDEKGMIPEPDLQTHVFCKVMEDVGDVEIERADVSGVNSVTLLKGDQFLLRYEPIRPLVANGSVVLL